jgi:chaperone required for assembly of F1-ATPase
MAGPSAANDALQRIKRFYKSVAVRPAQAGGFAVALDLRGVKTPDQAELILPTEAAAQLVADEWAAQEEYIRFTEMPATRHAFTAIDRVGQVRAEVVQEAVRYAGSDLLCYFAEAPAPLVERQTAEWGPILNWVEEALDLRFVRTAGINPQIQPPETLARIEALALEMDDFRLSALAFAGALFGSTILALALEKERLTGEEAHDLSRLDEAFQQEQWGVDAEAAERTSRQRHEAVVLEKWLKALKT